ncbi:DUF4124 domain-containing protein [Variovorax sp.]|uniref:DUF4124 domain-containing protein n=1 Tax=Variovorax sp. TaxID=1871043 RepID=UPI002D36C285|nr:DUF4124 domain-containing protein [Variovorax sp.]HYP85256.1 DUF4124 domain-containing protein [Variovorax sp.]
MARLTTLSNLALAAGLMLLAQTASAQGGQPLVREVFTCVDAQGRTLTADRPIAACSDREQRVLSPGGTVIRVLGPTLTAREQAEQEERERLAMQEAQRALEERRRARALLVRYPTPAAHDRERTEALAQIDVVIQAARNRVEELAQERTKVDQELEFYGRDLSRAPDSLRRQAEGIEQSTKVQLRFIADQNEEKRRVSARFDEERAQLMRLWPPSVLKGATTPASVSPASPSTRR